MRVKRGIQYIFLLSTYGCYCKTRFAIRRTCLVCNYTKYKYLFTKVIVLGASFRTSRNLHNICNWRYLKKITCTGKIIDKYFSSVYVILEIILFKDTILTKIYILNFMMKWSDNESACIFMNTVSIFFIHIYRGAST